MKKIFTCLLALTLLCTCLCFGALAEDKVITEINITFDKTKIILNKAYTYGEYDNALLTELGPKTATCEEVGYYINDLNTYLLYHADNTHWWSYSNISQTVDTDYIDPSLEYGWEIAVGAYRYGYVIDKNNLPVIKINGQKVTDFIYEPEYKEVINILSFGIPVDYIDDKTAERYAKTVSGVSLENFTQPRGGEEYKSDVKLSDGSHASIVKQGFFKGETELTGKAEDFDFVTFETTVKLTDGGLWSESPDAYLDGVKSDGSVRISDTECKFAWSLHIEKSDEVKIKMQPPETVEYKEGQDIILSVKAENAKKYKWEWYEPVTGTPKKAYKTTEIENSNTPQFVIEKADETFDGKMIRCTAMSDEKQAQTKLITLKMTEKKANGKEEDDKEENPETKSEDKKDGGITWSDASDWAEAELQKANDAALIPPLFDGENLTKNITRQEFAHVAVKLYEKLSGKNAEPVSENPFEDTNDTEVLKAFNVGITLGTSDTTFTPDSLITREQMATMLTRALKEAGIDTTVYLSKVEKFSDDDKMNDWGRKAIYFMSENGIILGMGDGSFGTLGNATREQALLISVRSAEKFGK